LLGASKSIQGEREKWQTRETLARGAYGGTPLHSNGKEKWNYK